MHYTLLGLKKTMHHFFFSFCTLYSILFSFHALFLSVCPSFFLSGGDAGEEVWRLLPEQTSGSHNTDGVPAVSHEQELSTAAQFRL